MRNIKHSIHNIYSTSTLIKKQLISFLLICVCLLSFNLTAVAATLTNENTILNDPQAQVNKTLSIVFEYLNNLPDIQIGESFVKSYIIPINKEQSVTATVENKEIVTSRSLEPHNPNSSYTYTVTLSNIYAGSGKIVHKVYYDTKGYIDNSTVLTVDATNVTTSSVAPDNWSKTGSVAYLDTEYPTLIETSSFNQFKRNGYKDINFYIFTSIAPHKDSKLMVDYYTG